MISELTTLESLFTDPSQRPLECCLYLDFEVGWDLSARAAVFDESGVEGTPPFALENGLRYVLGTNELNDVIEIAQKQVRNPSASQLLDAFLYYYDHDAFIQFLPT
jgi:hypothetical protein